MSLNLVLNAPFDIEFDRMTGIPEFPEEFIANYLMLAVCQQCRIDTILDRLDRYIGTKYTRQILFARR